MMERKVVGLILAVLCGAIAFYCADRAASARNSEYGPLGVAFAVLVPLFIVVGLTEGGSAGGSRDVHTEVHVHNHAPTQPHPQQVQYVPVYEPAPPPQIVYVEREAAPPQIGMSPAEVKQLFAQLQGEHQRLLPQQIILERKPPEQQRGAVRIEGGYQRMDVLPPARTMPPEPEPLPLRVAGPKKRIADRVAMALLAKPKTRIQAG